MKKNKLIFIIAAALVTIGTMLVIKVLPNKMLQKTWEYQLK